MWVRVPFPFLDIAPSSSKEFLEKFRQPQSVDSKTRILHDKKTVKRNWTYWFALNKLFSDEDVLLSQFLAF